MNKKRVIFWGTGDIAGKFVKLQKKFIQAVNVLGFTDSNKDKWGMVFEGYDVLCPDILLEQEYDYIFILSSYFDEIKECLLKKYNVSSDKILSPGDAYQLYVRCVHGTEDGRRFCSQGLISEMAFSRKMYDKMCTDMNNMFSYFYVREKYWKMFEQFKCVLECSGVRETEDVLKEDTNIWVCWLQGLETAPEIVKCCVASITANVKGAIHIITYDNYEEYVRISRHIVEKHRLGIISKTHFSDILRLALLYEYGGIWMDATIFMMDKGLPDYIYKMPVFMYRVRETWDRGYPDPRLFTNWFIKSDKNNPVIGVVYKICTEWWRTETEIPYCLFHYVMRIAWTIYEEVEFEGNRNQHRLILYDNNCRILQDMLNEKYDKDDWNMLQKEQPLQKLTYKKDLKKEGTFYEYITAKYIKDVV